MNRPCPRCSTALDEGPVVYRCSHCQSTVYAADLDTEFHASARGVVLGAQS